MIAGNWQANRVSACRGMSDAEQEDIMNKKSNLNAVQARKTSMLASILTCMAFATLAWLTIPGIAIADTPGQQSEQDSQSRCEQKTEIGGGWTWRARDLPRWPWG